ncbi:MAG: hypothetical protein V1719_00795 [Patescibacteria group bacterium]
MNDSSQLLTFYLPVLVFVSLIIFISSVIKSRGGSKYQARLLENKDGFKPCLTHYEGDNFDFSLEFLRQTGMYISRDAIEVRNPTGTMKSDCGHQSPRMFELHFLGTGYQVKGDRKCPDCAIEYLVSHGIRCASCGLPILPGAPIARYNIVGSHKPWTCYISEEMDGRVSRKTVIGCLRWDCCDTGAYFSGHWTEEGFAPAFGHGGNALDECYYTKEPVITNP